MSDNQQPFAEGSWNHGASWHFYFASELRDDPITAVAGILIKDEHILLTNNKRGCDITGGHIQPGETLIQALHREMLEEGGVIVDGEDLIGYMIVTNTRKIFNKATGTVYPMTSQIPFFIVTTKEALQPVRGEDCQGANFHHVLSDKIQHFRLGSILSGIYSHAKKNNFLV